MTYPAHLYSYINIYPGYIPSTPLPQAGYKTMLIFNQSKAGLNSNNNMVPVHGRLEKHPAGTPY